ncbi:MAG: glutamate-5-semialdehyde dehydrogenase [Phormidium sp.]
MTVSTVASSSLAESAHRTRQAAQQLGYLSRDAKNAAIAAVADSLNLAAGEILEANAADCEAAQQEGLAKPLYDRLKLSESKLQGAIAGVRDVGKLPDPVGVAQLHRELDDGLVLKRITCPLGVLGVIFEARPDAAIQIASLALKSGNGVIFKGGKEARHSCQAIVAAIHRGLEYVGLPSDAIQLLTTREEILELLQLDSMVDLIIPRGSNAFVRFVQENTRIPVLGHADGICHIFIDQSAVLDKAIPIVVDAKTHYPAACNAVETLLIHQGVAQAFLPPLAEALQEKGVTLRGDAIAQSIVEMEAATEDDWQTEYSDLVLAIRVVDSPAEAIAHINTYGSRHTEAIISEAPQAVDSFFAQVDAAGVFHNCSTRFADGFRYGFGAEVGISTQKLPPRGPVGLEGLVTYKYQVVGNGHIAATYSGEDAKPFRHRNL